ncbi:hypothetical protein [Indibacter alkaliphilus]|nr:hypothetical protein [Indibacter alkaliphilus]
MNKKQQYINLWKQRVCLGLVLFFCMLVTGAEYIHTPSEKEELTKKEYNENSENNQEKQTFLNVAVDAVVPFVTVVGQQVFYLIFENLKIEKVKTAGQLISVPVNLPYWEILLERIISPNAP